MIALPTELWTAILEYACVEWTSSTDTPSSKSAIMHVPRWTMRREEDGLSHTLPTLLILSSVCRTWRSILHHSPLFTSINDVILYAMPCYSPLGHVRTFFDWMGLLMLDLGRVQSITMWRIPLVFDRCGVVRCRDGSASDGFNDGIGRKVLERDQVYRIVTDLTSTLDRLASLTTWKLQCLSILVVDLEVLQPFMDGFVAVLRRAPSTFRLSIRIVCRSDDDGVKALKMAELLRPAFLDRERLPFVTIELDVPYRRPMSSAAQLLVYQWIWEGQTFMLKLRF